MAAPSRISQSALSKLGFKRYREYRYESGFFPGQTDRVDEEVARMFKHNPDVVEAVVVADEVSQFYAKWNIYVRREEA